MLRYVLVSGLLMWGLPMFVVMTFVISRPQPPVALSAILWSVGGVGFGVAMWFIQEHRYRKATQAH
ncbi:hypothetical protein EYV96_10065 [Dyella terrae]|uniref:DUF2530 domain-containing protein n=3 Tax=Rhodanobacteraceae TaxID=1775411 RepID=A0A4V2NML4_9GAMM|nr:hypothetical protein EYV96_10065 [Dyella terrae]TCI13747.1 hypothetical protein EZM97_00805 [Dyella soli]